MGLRLRKSGAAPASPANEKNSDLLVVFPSTLMNSSGSFSEWSQKASIRFFEKLKDPTVSLILLFSSVLTLTCFFLLTTSKKNVLCVGIVVAIWAGASLYVNVLAHKNLYFCLRRKRNDTRKTAEILQPIDQDQQNDKQETRTPDSPPQRSQTPRAETSFSSSTTLGTATTPLDSPTAPSSPRPSSPAALPTLSSDYDFPLSEEFGSPTSIDGERYLEQLRVGSSELSFPAVVPSQQAFECDDFDTIDKTLLTQLDGSTQGSLSFQPDTRISYDELGLTYLVAKVDWVFEAMRVGCSKGQADLTQLGFQLFEAARSLCTFVAARCFTTTPDSTVDLPLHTSPLAPPLASSLVSAPSSLAEGTPVWQLIEKMVDFYSNLNLLTRTEIGDLFNRLCFIPDEKYLSTLTFDTISELLNFSLTFLNSRPPHTVTPSTTTLSPSSLCLPGRLFEQFKLLLLSAIPEVRGHLFLRDSRSFYCLECLIKIGFLAQSVEVIQFFKQLVFRHSEVLPLAMVIDCFEFCSAKSSAVLAPLCWSAFEEIVLFFGSRPANSIGYNTGQLIDKIWPRLVDLRITKQMYCEGLTLLRFCSSSGFAVPPKFMPLLLQDNSRPPLSLETPWEPRNAIDFKRQDSRRNNSWDSRPESSWEEISSLSPLCELPADDYKQINCDFKNFHPISHSLENQSHSLENQSPPLENHTVHHTNQRTNHSLDRSASDPEKSLEYFLSSPSGQHRLCSDLATAECRLVCDLVGQLCRAKKLDLLDRLWGRVLTVVVSLSRSLVNRVLDELVSLGYFEKGLHYLSLAKAQGVALNQSHYGVLLKNCNSAENALLLFRAMIESSVHVSLVTCNSLINVCIQHDNLEHADSIYQTMLGSGVQCDLPDAVTYSTLFKGWCSRGLLHLAVSKLSEIDRLGIRPDTILFNTLLEGCFKCGNVAEAERLLEEMELRKIKPSSYTVSTLIKLYGRDHKIDTAIQIANELPTQYAFKCDAHVYTALMSTCLFNNRIDNALETFERMKLDADCVRNISARTYQTIISGCIKARRPLQATVLLLQAEIHSFKIEQRILRQIRETLRWTGGGSGVAQAVDSWLALREGGRGVVGPAPFEISKKALELERSRSGSSL